MNILRVKTKSIENGVGVRVSVFCTGCPIHCENCHNPEAQDFSSGVPLTEEWRDEIVKSVNETFISGMSLLGGEPLCDENINDSLNLCSYVKAHTHKSIWCYTGYTFDYLWTKYFSKYGNNALYAIDVLVDGPYIDSKRDPSLKFRGSTNQRILDFQASIRAGKPIELKL